MADISTPYTLTTDATDVVFNDGALGDGTDKFWLTAIQGLDGPAIRAPVDPIPFGDGGIIYTFLKGPRHVVFDGMLLIESSRSQSLCQTLRNDLAAELEAALEATFPPTYGTLSYTPAGQSPLEIDVYYEVGLVITYSDNYAVANFSFGMVSQASDPGPP